LYVDGKVCVSLLGTWSGQGSENWDPINSNLLQVLVSIQGLILVSEPYFNEPGFACQKGTEQGKKRSREYNEMVLLENLTCLTRLAENPPALFYNEVREHLIETSSGLAKRLETWMDKCKSENKSPSKQGIAEGGASSDVKKDEATNILHKTPNLQMFKSSMFKLSNLKSEGSTSTTGDDVKQSSKDDSIPLIPNLLPEVPDFPLAPVSSIFSSTLKRSLEILDKSVQKLIDKDVLSTRVETKKEIV
jgi:ubiquitin-conjugating enzyme E2 O